MSEAAQSITTEALRLAGLRVLQLGAELAPSLATMALAEQGAEVVVLRDGRKPLVDPVLHAMVTRGKGDGVIDFTAVEGRQLALRLASHADVVVEGDGESGALALSFEGMRAGANPGLVSCSIPAFPVGDPRRRLPRYEAVAGMAGFLYDKPLGGPRFHEFPVGSVMAGLFAACAVVAALLARCRLHRGQHVDTSLYESDLFAQVLQILVKTGVPRGFLPLKMVGTPFMSPWLCRDGRYIYLHVTLPAHNARILEVLESIGYREQVARLRAIMSPETMRDPSQVKSIGEAKRIRAAYERVFASRDAHEWEEVLGKELCCIKVRTIEEWVRDSSEAGMSDVCRLDDPLLGGLTCPGPVVVSERPGPVIAARRHLEAAGLDDVARSWESGPSHHAVAGGPSTGAAKGGPPLEGIRVVDLSRVIAGPCAGRILAELGAEVVSIQNPSGLDWALSFHLVFNAGKKSVTVDFTTDEGKKKLWALFDSLRPHALIQNYRHLDVARAVGVDPDAVKARFPAIVYTHLNAYGNEGGWQHRPGFEQVVQAVTGVQMTYARGAKPKLVPTPIIDIGSGLSGALATLIGLYHQERTGSGSFASTHLTSTAVLFQIKHIADLQRTTCVSHARQAGVSIDDAAGRRVVSTIVRALDNYMAIVGPAGDLVHWLRNAELRPGPLHDPLQGLERRFWRRPVAWWARSVRDAGVGDTVAIVPWPKIKRLVEDIREVDPGPIPAVRKREFPGCPAPLTFVRAPLHLSMTPAVDVPPPPLRGGDTRAMLEKIGERVPEGAGVVPYPPNKPLLPWLASFVRWGYFAWRSGNI
jgi:crotonobetainyl-CoA:carnitine CoA-transferase CaiB-like acyl-CoA transferase